MSNHRGHDLAMTDSWSDPDRGMVIRAHCATCDQTIEFAGCTVTALRQDPPESPGVSVTEVDFVMRPTGGDQ